MCFACLVVILDVERALRKCSVKSNVQSRCPSKACSYSEAEWKESLRHLTAFRTPGGVPAHECRHAFQPDDEVFKIVHDTSFLEKKEERIGHQSRGEIMFFLSDDTLGKHGRPELYLLASFVTIVLSLLAYEIARWVVRVPNFSGPRGSPVVGNLWQIYGKDAPLQYRDWSRKYGPVYQVQLGSIPILVVNTAAAAKAIFTQNSHATASRPEFYTFHKVCDELQFGSARIRV